MKPLSGVGDPDIALREFESIVEERLKGRVALIILFGSRVSGRHTPMSDVDVAVYPSNPGIGEKLLLTADVMEAASRAFGVAEDRVDVVFLDEELPLELAFEILSRGKLVYCENRELYSELRARVLSKYLDFKVFAEKLAIHEEYLKAVRRRVEGWGR